MAIPQVKTALDTILLPRTRAIEQDVSTLQSEAQIISAKSKEEHAEVEDDLAKMAKLVFDFQVCMDFYNGLHHDGIIVVTYASSWAVACPALKHGIYSYT